MSSFMGIGTDIYGEKNYDPQDGFYSATKWFIVFFLPIIPISSYRIRRVSVRAHHYLVSFGVSIQYEMNKMSLDWKQVFMTYLGVYGSITLYIVFAILLPQYLGITSIIFLTVLITWIVKKLVNNHKMEKDQAKRDE